MTSHSPSSPRYSVSQPVMEQAIRWQVRLLSGEGVEQHEQACQRWCQESEEHARAWQLVQRAQQVFMEPDIAQRNLLGKTLRRSDQAEQVDLKRRRTLKALAVTALAVPGLVAWREYNGALGLPVDYATATGEQRRIQLANGALLMLNTSSRVDARAAGELTLYQGEVLLDRTVGDASPMALVSSGRRYLVPAGASVLLRQHSSHDQVQIVKGRVEASLPGGYFAQIAENESVRVAADIQPFSDPSFDATGWLDGALVVRHMRLDRFLGELSRYRPGWLRCDPSVAALTLSGVFQLADTDRILTAVSHVLPVRASTIGPLWVTVRPA